MNFSGLTQRALEQQIEASVEACMSEKKAHGANVLFKRRESFRGPCTEQVRQSFGAELAAVNADAYAQEQTLNGLTTSAAGLSRQTIGVLAFCGLAVAFILILVKAQ